MRRDLEMKLRGILGTPTNAAGTHRPICLVTSVERDDLVHHAQPREAVLLELRFRLMRLSRGVYQFKNPKNRTGLARRPANCRLPLSEEPPSIWGSTILTSVKPILQPPHRRASLCFGAACLGGVLLVRRLASTRGLGVATRRARPVTMSKRMTTQVTSSSHQVWP